VIIVQYYMMYLMTVNSQRLNGISIDEKISHLRKKVQQTTDNNGRVSKDFEHQVRQ
jgi:hypothetical protein